MDAKVNKELYQEVKEFILKGNYTIEEVSATLRWIRMEYANKQNETARKLKVREVEDQPDQYGSHHQPEDGPDRED